MVLPFYNLDNLWNYIEFQNCSQYKPSYLGFVWDGCDSYIVIVTYSCS